MEAEGKERHSWELRLLDFGNVPSVFDSVVSAWLVLSPGVNENLVEDPPNLHELAVHDDLVEISICAAAGYT